MAMMKGGSYNPGKPKKTRQRKFDKIRFSRHLLVMERKKKYRGQGK